MRICSNCGCAIDEGARFCQHCGEAAPEAAAAAQPEAQNQYAQAQPASGAQNMVTPDQCKLQPIVAAICSFLLVGLGQMINGQTVKGIVMLVGTMVGGGILTLLTLGLFAFVCPLIWIASALDAYFCAKKLEEGHSIGAWSFFGR